jgi:hypothetical protein
LNANTLSNPSHGTLSQIDQSTGKVTYTPQSGYTGTDSFTFKVNDGTSASSNTGTVSISVTSGGNSNGGNGNAISGSSSATGAAAAANNNNNNEQQQQFDKKEVPATDFQTGEVVPGKYKTRYSFECYDVTTSTTPGALWTAKCQELRCQ